jgi:Galactose-1-phosphate uridyl transferase, N-terminal domain
VDAWADRTRELSALGAVEHVFCFENRGKEIGVTLHHPHGQIYAYPFLPARTAQILRQAAEHHDRTGRLMGADLLAAELDSGSRVVINAVRPSQAASTNHARNGRWQTFQAGLGRSSNSVGRRFEPDGAQPTFAQVSALRSPLRPGLSERQ